MHIHRVCITDAALTFNPLKKFSRVSWLVSYGKLPTKAVNGPLSDIRLRSTSTDLEAFGAVGRVIVFGFAVVWYVKATKQNEVVPLFKYTAKQDGRSKPAQDYRIAT